MQWGGVSRATAGAGGGMNWNDTAAGELEGEGGERGFLVYPGVRRAGAQEEGGGRAAGSGGFSRVTGAPPAVGWLVGSRGEEVGGGFGGLPRGKTEKRCGEWGV